MTNSCPAFDRHRTNAWKELDELRKTRVKMKDKYQGSLEKAFLDVFFKPSAKCEKELEVLRKFSLLLAITNSKNTEKRAEDEFSFSD